MEVFKYHIFICTQTKPEGVESCVSKSAEQTLAVMREEISKAGLDSDVQITTCGCLGLCGKGPNMIVYPDGVWYSEVSPDKVQEIVQSHLKNGVPVSRWARADQQQMKQEIIGHFNKVKALKELLDRGGMVPDELNALMRGFMESRIILTGLELDIFSAIGTGASAKQVSRKIHAPVRSTEALLNALCAIRVLRKQDEIFYNTTLSSRYLVAGSPDDSRSALMHIAHLWHRWSTLTDAVKKGTSVAKDALKKRSPEATRAFISAMHKNASFASSMVVAQIDLTGVNSLLDLGGGSGAYAIAFARKAPHIKITVFDLPEVIPLTKKYIAQAGLAETIQTKTGDMTRDDFGKGYDLVFVSAICHMFSPKENLKLFKRIKRALNPEGRIVIQDFVLNPDKTSPRFSAIFALNMLVNTRGGGTYSGKEYIDWLSRAGFHKAELVKIPGPTSLVIAKK